jgi:hypothetical protein
VEGEPQTPFDSVESAQQFLDLLAEAVEEARREVNQQIAEADAEPAQRSKQGLQLVSYNLAKLATHLAASRRILNDLRSLRRLLLEERQLERTQPDE